MKFQAMKCPLPTSDIGRKVIDQYQAKRERTLSAQRKASYQARKLQLIAQHREEYFKQRLKTTNEGEYHKFQLDIAHHSKAAPLDVSLSSPSTSVSSCEGQLKAAIKAAEYRKEALKQGKQYHVSRFNNAVQSRRLKQRAIKQMNKIRTAARNQGSCTARNLRSEHSYGSLNIL